MYATTRALLLVSVRFLKCPNVMNHSVWDATPAAPQQTCQYRELFLFQLHFAFGAKAI